MTTYNNKSKKLKHVMDYKNKLNLHTPLLSPIHDEVLTLLKLLQHNKKNKIEFDVDDIESEKTIRLLISNQYLLWLDNDEVKVNYRKIEGYVIRPCMRDVRNVRGKIVGHEPSEGVFIPGCPQPKKNTPMQTHKDCANLIDKNLCSCRNVRISNPKHMKCRQNFVESVIY